MKRPPVAPGNLPGRLRRALLVALAASFAAEPFLAGHAREGLAGSLGFYALYGFLTCLAAVAAALGLRRWLGRPDGYYGAGGGTGEATQPPPGDAAGTIGKRAAAGPAEDRW